MRTPIWLALVLALGTSLTRADSPDSPSIESLIDAVGDNDFFKREKALDALVTRRDTFNKYVPLLRERLGDEKPEKRQQAAMALAALGALEPMVIDELLLGMGQRAPVGTYLAQPERARSSMSALVMLGSKAVPALIKAMNDEQYAGRDLALEAIGKIGPDAKEALPSIENRLVTNDTSVFCRVVEVKWRIDGDAAFAIEKMVLLLDRKRGRECHAAVQTLVHMGDAAKEAMPALVSALKKHQDPNVLWAVGELGPHAKELAAPALYEALQQPRLANDAAIALQTLGEPAQKLIPMQLKRLRAVKAGDNSEPMEIVYTIVIHGPPAKEYVGDLIALLKHETPEVRRAAAWGVPRMFADDQLVTTALREALTDPETAEEAGKGLRMLEEARR
jgi:HEAT repeat protein